MKSIRAICGVVTASNPHYKHNKSGKCEKVLTATYTPNDLDGWGVSKDVPASTVIDTDFAIKLEIESEQFL